MKKMLMLVLSIVLVFSNTSVLNAKEKDIKLCRVLENKVYNLTGGIDIKDNDVFVFKATTKSPDKVALFKATITDDGSIGKFSCVAKFQNAELGHANDCTIYNDKIFVAPYGKQTTKGVKIYYTLGGKIGDKYYSVVSVSLDGYSVNGYEIENEDGTSFIETKIGGICYVDDKVYNSYPVFVLKGVNGQLFECFLKDNVFYCYKNYNVFRQAVSVNGNVDQGIDYHEGYLYFGLGTLNEKNVCGSMAYAMRTKFSDISTDKINVCEEYFYKDMKDTHSRFEIETVTFFNGKCIVSMNGMIEKDGKTVSNDGVYVIE